jgi:DHA2 family multidrug resistance protein-like MFS transporter
VTLALMLIELGLCAAITTAIDGIMASIPPAKAGAGGAVSETANELGVALGTAVLGSILVAVYRRQLADAPVAAQETLGAAHQTGDAGVVTAADAAFVDGVRVASVVTAVLLVLVAVASRRVSRSE